MGEEESAGGKEEGAAVGFPDRLYRFASAQSVFEIDKYRDTGQQVDPVTFFQEWLISLRAR